MGRAGGHSEARVTGGIKAARRMGDMMPNGDPPPLMLWGDEEDGRNLSIHARSSSGVIEKKRT